MEEGSGAGARERGSEAHSMHPLEPLTFTPGFIPLNVPVPHMWQALQKCCGRGTPKSCSVLPRESQGCVLLDLAGVCAQHSDPRSAGTMPVWLLGCGATEAEPAAEADPSQKKEGRSDNQAEPRQRTGRLPSRLPLPQGSHSCSLLVGSFGAQLLPSEKGGEHSSQVPWREHLWWMLPTDPGPLSC